MTFSDNGDIEPVADIDIEEEVSQLLKIERLQKCIEYLQEDYRVAIIARFGLDGEDWRSFKDIARILGMSRQGAKKLFDRAMGRLVVLYENV